MTRISKEQFYNQFIKCECGYFNHKEFVKISGVCKGCGKILDKKAKFKSEMKARLRIKK